MVLDLSKNNEIISFDLLRFGLKDLLDKNGIQKGFYQLNWFKTYHFNMRETCLTSQLTYALTQNPLYVDGRGMGGLEMKRYSEHTTYY